jgi:hypothetical protein
MGFDKLPKPIEALETGLEEHKAWTKNLEKKTPET